ncbi:UNVERIFIED_CONTAM: protein SPEAR1, partial [Sesamum latifolium]
MGSNYYGEGNPAGNERGSGFSSSSSSSSSSRKGKKGSSDKPKQPQRGLGVAQLEKIRLHSQLGSNYLPPVHNPYAPSFSQ